MQTQIAHSDILSSVKGAYWHEIEDIWPRIEEWIVKSCKRGGGKYAACDIKKALLIRDMQLWIAGDCEAIAITEIIQYPRKRVMRICMGAGAFRKYFKEFIEVAEACECDGYEALTRLGFAKLFQSCGWKKTQIYMEKEV